MVVPELDPPLFMLPSLVDSSLTACDGCSGSWEFTYSFGGIIPQATGYIYLSCHVHLSAQNQQRSPLVTLG